jgi:hypothetical protein
MAVRQHYRSNIVLSANVPTYRCSTQQLLMLPLPLCAQPASSVTICLLITSRHLTDTST